MSAPENEMNEIGFLMELRQQMDWTANSRELHSFGIYYFRISFSITSEGFSLGIGNIDFNGKSTHRFGVLPSEWLRVGTFAACIASQSQRSVSTDLRLKCLMGHQPVENTMPNFNKWPCAASSQL